MLDDTNRTPGDEAPPHDPLAGGGGGSLGGTLSSRLGEALSGMDAAQAADTGGIGIDPTVILPGGDNTAGWTDTAANRANFELTNTSTETPWANQRIEESVRINELRECLDERARRDSPDAPR